MRGFLLWLPGAIFVVLAYMATRLGSQAGKTAAQRRVAHGMIVAFNMLALWSLYMAGSIPEVAVAYLTLFLMLALALLAIYMAATTPFFTWWVVAVCCLGLLVWAACSQQQNSLWAALPFS